MNTYQKIILAAALTSAFIWLSNDEFNHELKQAEQYNQDASRSLLRFCAGLIPDYKDIEPTCEGEK